MKIQNLLFALLLLCLPFSAFCQLQRTLDREQSLELRLGALRNLEDMAYRFEVAWQEQDCSSLQDIRQELLRMMQVEIEACSLLKPKSGNEDGFSSLRERQQRCLNEFSNYILPAAPSEFSARPGDAPLAPVAAFRKLTLQTLEVSY